MSQMALPDRGVMSLDLERIIAVCREHDYPLTIYYWADCRGPAEDILVGIHPIMVEPMHHYGLRKLWNLLGYWGGDMVAGFFYDITASRMTNIYRGVLDIGPWRRDNWEYYYTLGQRFREMMREAGLYVDRFPYE